MNIDDVRAKVEVPKEGFIPAMFREQLVLMAKYDVIEKRNGSIIPEAPYCIDHRKVQNRLKDLFWRVTEEIAEAFEDVPYKYLLSGAVFTWRSEWDNDARIRHFFEELADAIHFLVEASILAGINPDDIVADTQDMANVLSFSSIERMNGEAFRVIVTLGLAANMLKNKPWKNTEMTTDARQFNRQMVKVWRNLLFFLAKLSLTPLDIWSLYARKNTVNHFRQRSNY